MSTASATETQPTPYGAPGVAAERLTLRASLLLHGVRLEEPLAERLQKVGHWLPSGVDQYRLELRLPDGTVVTPLMLSHNHPDPGWSLVNTGSTFALRFGNTSQPVVVPAPPSFYERTTSSGRRMGEFAQVYGSVLVLGGRQACGYSISGSACRFCRVGSRAESERTFGVTPFEAAEATTAAFRERSLRYVFLPAASFDADDGGVREVEPLVRAIRRHTSALVLAALHPPRTLRWIDHAYAIGIDGVSFNLEVPDVTILERLLPGRARYLGRSRYLQALRHAGKIFPRGAVWTELLLGAGSIADLRPFLEELLSWNVLPYFVPSRPEFHSRMSPRPGASSAEEIVSVASSLCPAVSTRTLGWSWLPIWPHMLGLADLSPNRNATVPGRPEGAPCKQLEFFALRNLARLRRSLRVRDLAEHELE